MVCWGTAEWLRPCASPGETLESFCWLWQEEKVDFSYSKEQMDIIMRARAFGEKYFTEPSIKKWCADRGIDPEVTQAYRDEGLGYLGMPDFMGGVEAGIMTHVLVTEEFTRIAGATLPFQSQAITVSIINQLDKARQREVAKRVFGTQGLGGFSLAFSEPIGGSDNFSMITAVTEEDGQMVLNGEKIFVMNGEFAPHMFVITHEHEEDFGENAFSMWLIPRDLPGVRIFPMHKMGQEMMPFSLISFDNVPIKPDYLVGERGAGLPILMSGYEIGRIIVCAASLGLAEAAMEDAVSYANRRSAFEHRIVRHGQIAEKLTDMEVKLRTMRSMLYQVAWEKDQGRDVRLSSALLKRYVPKTAVEVASEALQIFGGIGYTDMTRESRIFCDCRGNQIAEGTDEVMVRIATKRISQKYVGADAAKPDSIL